MTSTIGTKRGLRIAGIVALAASIGAIRVAAAQQEDTLKSVDVSQCVGLATPEERLACFEARVEAAGGAPAGSGAPAAGSASAAAGTAAAGKEGEAETQPDIIATITALRETVPNSYLITLDNGQVWRQKVPQAYALRTGYVVRIYYSRWRTYRLTNEQLKSYIQVERVR